MTEKEEPPAQLLQCLQEYVNTKLDDAKKQRDVCTNIGSRFTMKNPINSRYLK